MKFKKRLAPLLTGAISLSLAFADPGQASPKKKYFCAQHKGIYTTFIHVPQGNVEMIHWKSDTTGFSLKARCIEVSNRFQGFFDSRVLEHSYMGYDTLNNYPVLCIVSKPGDSCNTHNLLLTLNLEDDPAEVRSKLCDIRAIVRGKPIELSNDQLITYENGKSYLNMKLLEEALPSVKQPIPDQQLTPAE